jgi:uncharacterized protein YidB (DUF937 family)
MGLMDILNGMQNGPRGQRQPAGTGSGSGGMSPLTMALLGLLAYKALQHFGSSGQPNAAPTGAGPRPDADTRQASAPGGLGDLLKGGLGGLLTGGAAGSVLSGGLSDLLRQFQQSGQGDVAKSWVGTGPNKQITPRELERALGDETVGTLADQAGLSRLELLSGLSQQLPDFVDQLTPHGRLPTAEEMSKLV